MSTYGVFTFCTRDSSSAGCNTTSAVMCHRLKEAHMQAKFTTRKNTCWIWHVIASLLTFESCMTPCTHSSTIHLCITNSETAQMETEFAFRLHRRKTYIISSKQAVCYLYPQGRPISKHPPDICPRNLAPVQKTKSKIESAQKQIRRNAQTSQAFLDVSNVTQAITQEFTKEILSCCV